VVAGWYAQGLWTLWMAPMALAVAYYVVPKSTGRALPSYDFASLGFWCLLFVGAWTGGRHLIGGPVPAWISTIAIVASSTLLFHYAIVWVNLRTKECSLPLAFIRFGLCAYVLGGVLDALTAIRGVAEVTQFTYFDQAQQELAFYGAISMMLLGGLYYALPRLTGRPWAYGGLARAHLFLTAGGIVVRVAALGIAGLIQGRDLNHASVTFAQMGADTHPWLLVATVSEVILLLGNVLLLVNFFKTALCPYYAAAVAAYRQGQGIPTEVAAR
jgi:cytochrome c oxidase cbb3-type subunit 1